MSRNALRLEVDKLTEPAILRLAENMRESDRDECFALGHTPTDALMSGLLLGPSFGVYRWRGMCGPACIGAFGCCPYLGTIWSLWAEDITWQEGHTILKETPRWVRMLVDLAGGRTLHNTVDIRNTLAIEWLEHTGMFTMSDTLDQINGQTFLHFHTDGLHV